MHVIFKDEKIITSPNIDAEAGWFSGEHPVSFEKCRERFALTFTPASAGFYFYHPPLRGENVAHFLAKTEHILTLPAASTYAPTNRANITWVEPCPFWKVCAMRRSVLTLFVRAGMVYDRHRDNYEEALFSEACLGRTKPATMRFLFGFTRYTGDSIEPSPGATLAARGWLSVFEFVEEAFVRRTLVLEDGQAPVAISKELGEGLWY